MFCVICGQAARNAEGILQLVGHGMYSRQVRGLVGWIIIWIQRFLCLVRGRSTGSREVWSIRFQQSLEIWEHDGNFSRRHPRQGRSTCGHELNVICEQRGCRRPCTIVLRRRLDHVGLFRQHETQRGHPDELGTPRFVRRPAG
jgi:hypothetical protein